ncbi:DNA repair protein RadC [Aquabacterium soli]|uniref:DNA repair protein RadC n=1 Tax=Aquabacterium soli TaxID=2493092 RepID=A0A3R8YK20_9BURK|nr:DNA repair protein RadC [Aquabacterium soli]RRS01202.1 DNA repair protein RadC [Aquabacterium soli]
MTTEHFDHYIHLGNGIFRPATADQIIATAMRALDAKIIRHGSIASPADAKALACLRLGQLKHEVFAAIFVDAQHRIIEFVELFRGTLTQTSVYPREVVIEALNRHAHGLVIVHNHPSGYPEPSRADELLTSTLKSALALVDVRLLDHLVVAGGQVVSFAERGLL